MNIIDTSSQSVTLKSLMPIACKRNVEEVRAIMDEAGMGHGKNTIEVQDLYGNEYNLPSYYVFVFRKEIPMILFYLSKGIQYTLDYLNVSNTRYAEIKAGLKSYSGPDISESYADIKDFKIVSDSYKKYLWRYIYIGV